MVWFGENIDPDVLERSSAAAARADVFLSIGTSSLVYPAAGLLHHAKRNGAFTVEINPGATDVSRIGRSADRRAGGRRARDARRRDQDGLSPQVRRSAGVSRVRRRLRARV